MISSIPNYFNNSETPIICYKYNKPIRSTIINFNKIVTDIDIENQDKVPTLYWLPKLHKNPIKQDLLLILFLVRQQSFLNC